MNQFPVRDLKYIGQECRRERIEEKKRGRRTVAKIVCAAIALAIFVTIVRGLFPSTASEDIFGILARRNAQAHQQQHQQQ